MLQAKHQRFLELEQIFAPTNTWQFIGLAVVSLLFNLFSSGNLAGLIGVPLVAVLFAGRDWQKRRRSLEYIKQLTYEPTKKAPSPARGLILLISPYSPFKPELKDPDRLGSMLDTITGKAMSELTLEDFEQIGICNSNLKPQIEAVKFHAEQGALRDVWLICSETYESGKKLVKGSEPAAKLLQQYLSFKYGQQIHVHCQIVNDHNYEGLWKLVEDIFRNSGIKDEALVADVTGGTKMMSVAMAIACIPEGRRMQYMDSQRDWKGEPLGKGEMSPVAIDIDPLVYPSFDK
jgi:CRISPR-associated protein (Cas_Cas02710)